MKKKLGLLLAVVLTLCMSVSAFADAGKSQQVDYKTDYYMIVESPDGGVDMFSETSTDSPKLNDELIPNGTAIHVEGESKDDAGNLWLYTQLHGMFGFLEEKYLKPATLAEAVASELALYGSTDVNYDITVNAKEDGSVSLYKGPGKKYGTVSGGCNIANGEKLHIDVEVDTGKDGIWGKTTAGDVSGWVDIAQATNTEQSSVELIPDTAQAAEETGTADAAVAADTDETNAAGNGSEEAGAADNSDVAEPQAEDGIDIILRMMHRLLEKLQQTLRQRQLQPQLRSQPTPQLQNQPIPAPQLQNQPIPAPRPRNQLIQALQLRNQLIQALQLRSRLRPVPQLQSRLRHPHLQRSQLRLPLQRTVQDRKHPVRMWRRPLPA